MSKHRTGLVVEGGGTKIAYTCGALLCFLENNIDVDYTVGVSAGAEALLPFISRQPDRLKVTGIEAPCIPECLGIKPIFRERSVFGIQATSDFIQKEAPLDFEAFFQNPTELDVGLYDLEAETVVYKDKMYVDESFDILKASCALFLLCRPQWMDGRKYIDAGLVDMIPIFRAETQGCDRMIVMSTKEEGYVRKPAKKWQTWLSTLVYHDKTLTNNLRHRHDNYNKQWSEVDRLEKEGKVLVLRPTKDLGITRYTREKEKLEPWFWLGYDETKERLDEIRHFLYD